MKLDADIGDLRVPELTVNDDLSKIDVSSSRLKNIYVSSVSDEIASLFLSTRLNSDRVAKPFTFGFEQKSG